MKKTYVDGMTRIVGIGLEVALVVFLAGMLLASWKTPTAQASLVKNHVKKTASLRSAALLPREGSICLQDDSNGNIIFFTLNTGSYSFTNCAGFTLSGIGSVINKGSSFTLQHFAPDRRVLIYFDSSVLPGKADVQIFSPSKTFTIRDRNKTDDTCVCGGPPPPPLSGVIRR